MRQVVVYPGEDGFWVAECPSLPGCISQGRTREEAIANIREAIRGYVAVLEEDHLPVPVVALATVRRRIARAGVKPAEVKRAVRWARGGSD
jgi:predicted RNase H-like HicB family nuclease